MPEGISPARNIYANEIKYNHGPQAVKWVTSRTDFQTPCANEITLALLEILDHRLVLDTWVLTIGADVIGLVFDVWSCDLQRAHVIPLRSLALLVLSPRHHRGAGRVTQQVIIVVLVDPDRFLAACWVLPNGFRPPELWLRLR